MEVTTLSYQTVVVGSGAAGLAVAVRLREYGVKDFVVVSEGVYKGASINTGSDKQTYYKLGMSGATPDSPRELAETYLSGGAADGELALVEAANSTRAFMKLVELGVPFPHDPYGQYVGYKTDHDPRRRATSCGPNTSREMCLALLRAAERLDVKFLQDRFAFKLITKPTGDYLEEFSDQKVPKRKVLGVAVLNLLTGDVELVRCRRLIVATGGPSGIYETSAYPDCHDGGIGLALEAGALARGLPESQFGLASTTKLESRNLPPNPFGETPKEFRWNVSGTYMQALPRFISTGDDGESDVKEFLLERFASPEDALNNVFLKGYQWPFDASKALDGSSVVDLCVFFERSQSNRRVFLDFTQDPTGLNFNALSAEAREYLTRSDALLPTPIARLQKMNPGAIEKYLRNGVDLAKEPLEIAVCAQHNNGGLAVDGRYRSLNIAGLFAIGEVAGAHGVTRPGGSALNSGQVGALRVAELIARGEDREDRRDDVANESGDDGEFVRRGQSAISELVDSARGSLVRSRDPAADRAAFQRRTTRYAGIFREREGLETARREAEEQLRDLRFGNFEIGRKAKEPEIDLSTLVATARNLQLCVAERLYVESTRDEVVAGVGSRGSQITLADEGTPLGRNFPVEKRFAPEDVSFRSRAFYAYYELAESPDAPAEIVPRVFNAPTKPIPEPDDWFENVWRDFREGKNYR